MTYRYHKMKRVPYPIRESEFEVQAALYSALLQEGFHVRGEVYSRFHETDERCRVQFDLVVFDTLHSAVVIIECKNSANTLTHLGTRQEWRYRQFGVPVLICSNSKEIQKTVDAVKEISDALDLACPPQLRSVAAAEPVS